MSSRLRVRTVVAFHNWARAQRRPFRPFVEIIDGRKYTPLDLLVESPPLSRIEEIEYLLPWQYEYNRMLMRSYEVSVGAIRLARIVLGRQKPRVWIHVLNVVAVYEEIGEDDVLDVIAAIDPLSRPHAEPELGA